jgi:hypothetical protein
MIDTMMMSLALEVAQVYFLASVLKAMRERSMLASMGTYRYLDRRGQLGDPEYV